MAMEEFPNQLNNVKELSREHSKWVLRFTSVHLPSHEELVPIIVIAKAYRVKYGEGKKSK